MDMLPRRRSFLPGGVVINSATTIVSFLLVALLQATQRRSEAALQHKLDAIAYVPTTHGVVAHVHGFALVEPAGRRGGVTYRLRAGT
jgi:hypothetical protein